MPFDPIAIDVTTDHAIATFRPIEAMGSTVDKEPMGSIPRLYARRNVDAMLGAGLGWLSYRLFTELSSQDWHWNPRGHFSAGDRGYWTSSSSTSGPLITDSYQYALPHRGSTSDQGNNASYSRIDDGDPSTYWKSNPYLTHLFTHQPDSAHPQWVVADLGKKRAIDTVRIAWGNPYATRYAFGYWTGDDPFNDPGHGRWIPFANGTPVRARWVRLLMTASSNTCDTHGPSDPRNCVGYAIRELSIGRMQNGGFIDLVRHAAGARQTPMMVSSVDPWHSVADKVRDQEQPGLDLIARSGLIHGGVGGTYPVAMLYSTPENAVAEVRYLRNRGYPIRFIELGEEPDGQYVTPEDDAELYAQWARALHANDPSLRLGGPVFSGANDDIPAWPDARGDVSWLHRFLNYLRARNALDQLSFFSFEHYPFDGCEHGVKLRADLLSEAGLMRHMTQVWRGDGLPPRIPMYVTEANFSAVNFTQTPMQIEGGLWLADYFASALANGVKGVVYYQSEPVPLSQNAGCPKDWGNLTMFVAGNDARIRAYGAQYYAAQMLAKQWVQPGDGRHEMYRARTATPLLTAYVVKRPDGQWSVLIDNKDERAHAVTISLPFAGTITCVTFGPSQYVWHAQGANSQPRPDDPPAIARIPASSSYIVPADSLVVLRGRVH